MSTMNSRREGFALAGAVLAMVLVGAIVTGGFYAANQESQITRSAEIANLAQYIAEVGLESTTARTSFNTMDAMAVNSTITPFTDVNVTFGGTVVGRYTATVTRITTRLFVVRSTGTVTTGGMNSGATRTVSSVVRLRNVDFDNQTAMQVYSDLEVGGNSVVSGTDVSHSTWTGCSAPTSTTSAVTAQPGASITTQGSGQISGGVTRQSMDSTFFTVFGDMTWDDLKRLADKKYIGNSTANPQSSLIGLACNTSELNNWGEPENPLHACASYFPIIYASANLTIQSNGVGQGILLVEGNLDIQGTFAFYGPIVVRGTTSISGTADIYGSIISYGGGTVGTESSLGQGTSVVHYSSCGIKRAVDGINGLQRGVPIRNRSFMDLTSVQNSY